MISGQGERLEGSRLLGEAPQLTRRVLRCLQGEGERKYSWVGSGLRRGRRPARRRIELNFNIE